MVGLYILGQDTSTTLPSMPGKTLDQWNNFVLLSCSCDWHEGESDNLFWQVPLLRDVHWSVTVPVWTESDLLLFCLQQRLSEFAIRVKTTESPAFQFDAVQKGRRTNSWWKTITTALEMKVLCFASIGPLHDFSPVAVRTDTILSDVGDERNFYRFGSFDTAAANSCRKRCDLRMKDYCWVFLTWNWRIQHCENLNNITENHQEKRILLTIWCTQVDAGEKEQVLDSRSHLVWK